MRFISCTVDPALDGAMVEEVLRQQLQVSRRLIRRAKQVPGALLLDGEPVWTVHTVRAGQQVGIAIDDATLEPDLTTVAPERGELGIVYEDDDLIVVNKPADMVMYPGPSHDGGTLANYLVDYLQRNGKECNLHPVQRLDKGTTGLVVFATSSYVQDILQSQLHTSDFAREYLALCEGWLGEDVRECAMPSADSACATCDGAEFCGVFQNALSHDFAELGDDAPAARVGSVMFDGIDGTVDAPIACDNIPHEDGTPGRNVYSVAAHGKPAITHFHIKRQFEFDDVKLSLARLRLETGRTHQIRLHMAYLGHPLLGDDAYGNSSELIARPALHSASLRLVHPITKKRLTLEAPLPADIRSVL